MPCIESQSRFCTPFTACDEYTHVRDMELVWEREIKRPSGATLTRVSPCVSCLLTALHFFPLIKICSRNFAPMLEPRDRTTFRNPTMISSTREKKDEREEAREEGTVGESTNNSSRGWILVEKSWRSVAPPPLPSLLFLGKG